MTGGKAKISIFFNINIFKLQKIIEKKQIIDKYC